MHATRGDGKRRLVGLALLVAVAGVAPPAWGKGDARAKAMGLTKQGLKACAAGSYSDGISLLEKANALAPNPDIVFNIALAYSQWRGHCVEAKAAFDRFFAVCEECDSLEIAKQRAVKLAEQCQATLRIVGPRSAAIWVDGAKRGKAPLTLKLEPGGHVVRAELPKHEPAKQDVVLEPGKERQLELVLRPVKVAPSPKPKASAPKPAPERPAQAPPAKPVAPDLPQATPPGAKTGRVGEQDGGGAAWAWVGLGAGAAGLLGGGALLLLASGTHEEFEDAKYDGQSSIEDINALERTATVQTVAGYGALGLGAAALVAGVTLLVLGGEEPEQAAWQPLLLPGGLGMRRAF